MSRTWKVCLGAGLLLSNSLTAFATERTVYDFKGWKVTVNSRVSDASPTDGLSFTQNRRELPTILPRRKPTTSNSFAVIPVSMQQTESVVPPSPDPDATTSGTDFGPAPADINRGTHVHSIDPLSSMIVIPCEGCALPIIIPRPTVETLTPATVVSLPNQALAYREVYDSIPFSRAEYQANPSYRHDATMELLFGQLRPTVIQRGTTNVNHYYHNNGWNYPLQPYYPYSLGLRIHQSR